MPKSHRTGKFARILAAHGRTPDPPPKTKGTEPAWVAKLGERKRKHAYLLRLNDAEARELETLIVHQGTNASAVLRFAVKRLYVDMIAKPIEKRAEEEVMAEVLRRTKDKRIEEMTNELADAVRMRGRNLGLDDDLHHVAKGAWKATRATKGGRG